MNVPKCGMCAGIEKCPFGAPHDYCPKIKEHLEKIMERKAPVLMQTIKEKAMSDLKPCPAREVPVPSNTEKDMIYQNLCDFMDECPNRQPCPDCEKLKAVIAPFAKAYEEFLDGEGFPEGPSSVSDSEWQEAWDVFRGKPPVCPGCTEYEKRIIVRMESEFRDKEKCLNERIYKAQKELDDLKHKLSIIRREIL